MTNVETDPGTPGAVDYRSKIPPQAENVRRITDEFATSPSDDLREELERETERWRYYMNAAKGNPKNRARLAAEIAKRSVLNNAVVQPK